MLEEKGMLAQNLENWIENERRESELNGKFEAALLMIQRFNMSVKDVAEELKIPIKELMERLSQNDTPKS